MPRFAILEHDFPERHWDFMLEAGDVLRTWKLHAPLQRGEPVKAEVSFDHRLVYLEYEGPISGNRGSVIRWDAGSFEWQHDDKDLVRVFLDGMNCKGSVELVRETDKEWLAVLGDFPRPDRQESADLGP